MSRVCCKAYFHKTISITNSVGLLLERNIHHVKWTHCICNASEVDYHIYSSMCADPDTLFTWCIYNSSWESPNTNTAWVIDLHTKPLCIHSLQWSLCWALSNRCYHTETHMWCEVHRVHTNHHIDNIVLSYNFEVHI